MGSVYINTYESRPMLNVRTERNRRFTALSFVEAVCQDRVVPVDELIPAYRVAGDAFIGRMKRLFIILDDDEAVQKPAKASSIKKKKRQASGEGGSGTKKKMPATQ
jgi:hypothetical protein